MKKIKLEIIFGLKEILFILLVLIGLCSIGYLAYAFGTDNPETFGHDANEILVTVDGQQKTLQDAIEDFLDDFKLETKIVWGEKGTKPYCPEGYLLVGCSAYDYSGNGEDNEADAKPTPDHRGCNCYMNEWDVGCYAYCVKLTRVR